MLAQWIGDLIGEMHKHRISKTRLAEQLGVTREYVSMILNGHREPSDAQDRFTKAVAEIINQDFPKNTTP